MGDGLHVHLECFSTSHFVIFSIENRISCGPM